LALNRRSMRWFEASPCRAAPEGQPPSPAQLRTVRQLMLNYISTSYPGPLQSPICAGHEVPGSQRRRSGHDRPAVTALAGAQGVSPAGPGRRPAPALKDGSTVASPQVRTLPGDFAMALTSYLRSRRTTLERP
jgi:hypothetical protein